MSTKFYVGQTDYILQLNAMDDNYNLFKSKWYGASTTDPTLNPLGGAIAVGDAYFNLTSNLLKIYNGTSWQASDINTANLAANTGATLIGTSSGSNLQTVLNSKAPVASPSFTGNVSTTGNIQSGTGIASTSQNVVANGGASGTAAGGAIVAQNNTSTIIAMGNKSCVVGGAYDATPYIYGSTTISMNVGLNLLSGNLGLSNSAYVSGKTAGGTSTRLIGINGSDAVYIGSVDAAASSIRFNNNGVDQLVIDSSGNAALGNPSPKVTWSSGSVPLMAVEKVASYAAYSAYVYNNASSGGGMIVLGKSRGSTLGTLASTASGDALGFVTFEGVNTTPALVGAAYIKGAQDGAAGASWIPGRMELYTSDGTGAPVERARLDSLGNFGLGTLPGCRLDVQATSDGTIGNFRRSNGTQNPGIKIVISEATGTVGFDTIYSTTTPAVTFSQGGAERMRIDTGGNLLIGVASGTEHTINGSSTTAAKNLNVGNNSIQVYRSDAAGENAANAVLKVQKLSSTGRSINAGGTINASGTDYAEYMPKAEDCGTIAKGQIVGIDSNGKLTDKWANSISFLIKSTSPSLVGGDMWGSETAIGKYPVEPVLDISEEDGEGAIIAKHIAYETKLQMYRESVADYQARLEVARQKVDRIAYTGQVPVNVVGAAPGQYIVPVQDGEGIKGMLVDDSVITFEQYKKAVGVVQNILADGRANVRVKVV